MVHFSKERMASVIDSHDRCWRGELNRALIRVHITDRS